MKTRKLEKFVGWLLMILIVTLLATTSIAVPDCTYKKCENTNTVPCICGTTQVSVKWCCAAKSTAYSDKANCEATCSSGTCPAPTCTSSESGTKRCDPSDNKKVQVCGWDYTYNCYRWGTWTTCSSNQVCQNGQCVSAGAVCGNGKLESGEECDGTDFGGKTCSNYGCTGGSLTCTSGCKISTSSCSGCGGGTEAKITSLSCDKTSLALNEKVTCHISVSNPSRIEKAWIHANSKTITSTAPGVTFPSTDDFDIKIDELTTSQFCMWVYDYFGATSRNCIERKTSNELKTEIRDKVSAKYDQQSV
ncbi:MAG: hypothetical protein QXY62_06025, partial [Candidatus Altiarchaeota archaeon]